MWILLLGLAWSVSYLFTGQVRRYALSRSILDVPNERSSHQTPTPRGGGLAIVLSFLGTVVFLYFFNGLPSQLALGLLGSGLVVALIGFLDDHGHIAARWRLLAHFAAASSALYWLGKPPVLLLPGIAIESGWLGWVLAALYLVWLLNLYNFMDGIDGIAAGEAVSVSLSAAALAVICDLPFEYVLLPLILAACVAGFLVWNFPPARIFMGDAGSGFLGIVLGVMSLQAARVNPDLLWAWLILLGVFVVDATLTLLRRLFRGERVYEAHRSHAYQFASRRYRAHRPVTLAVLVINWGWLTPWALVVASGVIPGAIALLIAYVPLIILAFRFKAGARD